MGWQEIPREWKKCWRGSGHDGCAR